MKATQTTKTLATLTSDYNALAIAAGKNPRKSFESKAKAIEAIAALTPKGARKTMKVAQVRAKGPRGFKVNSPAWLKSIFAVAGIATKPANLPKLLDTADVHGVKVTKDLSQEEIVRMVAKAM